MAANNPGVPASIDKETAFTLAQSEMEYRVELFNRLVHTCFNKCVDRRYKENELNMGENSCIDRCTAKYWAVNNIVGQMISGGQQRPM
ncbi:protein transporter tim10 [Turnera subulata]|uniref:Mitochondrial import inner membrane translocase subunit n=1 Tax=Turnera subulata TaxID=218843 RepID=A0A9Q0GCL0_9ROSI|nr:protein transporter tim10 [Turnera subulata]